MEPKGGELEKITYQRDQERLKALNTLKGFLEEEGVIVGQGIESVECGLETLFSALDPTNDSDDDEASATRAMITELYERKGDKKPPSLTLSLASGRHSLWGHKLWNAAKYLSEVIDAEPSICRGKNILELGAGAGCPGLIASLNGARRVVLSDYANIADTVLIDAIQANIDRVSPLYVPQGVLTGVGYIWGQAVLPLLAPLEGAKFDVILAADLIFNRSEHEKLLWTIYHCLNDQGGGTALISYSHHDPKKQDQDLRFFTLAKEAPFHFVVEDVSQAQMVDLFVENDGLDEERGVVYLKKLKNMA